MEKFEIIGESEAIRSVKAIAKKIADSPNISTLILGENGTGKELVARYVHQHSANSDKPFVDINCGAIPESLLESELFGYEKGAFTGAHQSKPGLFELADGGTIFLDEVGNTSPGFQSKLLKAVETKRFRGVGGLKEIKVTTRIIAATNVDLQEAVKDKKFRADLYYRLNIGQIHVPPLRKRGDDSIILANHFLQACNQEYGKQVLGIRPQATDIIQRYPWPGNVRQLKNTIERAVLIESDEWVEADDLNLDFEWQNITRITEQAHSTSNFLFSTDKFNIPTKGIALEELEKGIISSAIDKAEGNLSQAARLLKITRGKLRYRMDKLNIQN